MSTPDIQALLAPVDGDAPCGPDLEYDSAFLALERKAAVRAEQVVGDSVIEAEEPDWPAIETMALALFPRTLDLRVAMRLCAAWTRMRGVPGWADGLALARGLVETYWDSVHPQLDAEDDDDPTARVNAVVGLSDPLGMLGMLRTTAFVQSPRLGRYSLRDLRLATGVLTAADGTATPSLAEIEACCLDCAQDDLEATLQGLRQAMQDARAIDEGFTSRIGTLAPDFRLLLADLRELEGFVARQWALRTGQGEGEGAAVDAAAEDAGNPAGGGGGQAVASGRIAGPADVQRRLDEICDYYARSEPSSPVPLLLRRARRLVGCNFIDLLRDLAPGGMEELERVSGRLDSEES